MVDNIVSTPLIFPKVAPSDWDQWWKIWFQESKTLYKPISNHNLFSPPGLSALRGFDLYRNKEVVYSTGYKGNYVNCEFLFEELISNLDLLPIHVGTIKAVASSGPMKPHNDWPWEEFSVRSLMYDNNVYKNFYYVLEDKKIYQEFPEDTNTWGYWDNKGKHGTDFYEGHSKILLYFYGPLKKSFDISDSIEKYEKYVIYDNLINS
jgi:hypothetical protein